MNIFCVKCRNGGTMYITSMQLSIRSAYELILQNAYFGRGVIEPYKTCKNCLSFGSYNKIDLISPPIYNSKLSSFDYKNIKID